MIQAKNVMNRKTPVLAFSDTVPQAIEYLKAETRGFAIVRASGDRFHGVLTEGQLMRIFLRYQQDPTKDSLILYRDLFEPAQLINENEYFPEIVKKLVTSAGHRVFVIDSETKVVGYITAKDILPYFSPTGDQGSASTADSKPMEALKSDLYLYESFFEKSPFMMHSANRSGVLTMANEMLHAVLGYEFGALLGRTIFDLYPESQHAKAKAGLKALFSEGHTSIVAGEMLKKNGELLKVELVSKTLTDQFQDVVGTMTVSHPQDMRELLEAMPK